MAKYEMQGEKARRIIAAANQDKELANRIRELVSLDRWVETATSHGEGQVGLPSSQTKEFREKEIRYHRVLDEITRAVINPEEDADGLSSWISFYSEPLVEQLPKRS